MKLGDYNVNAKHLAQSDKVVSLNSTETEEYLANASLNDNFQELEKTIPEWDQDTHAKLPYGRFTQANWRLKAEWSTKLANGILLARNDQKPTRPEMPGKRPEQKHPCKGQTRPFFGSQSGNV